MQIKNGSPQVMEQIFSSSSYKYNIMDKDMQFLKFLISSRDIRDE